MLILSSVLNVVLLALLIYVQRRRSNLAARLKHMGDMFIRVSKDNHALQAERERIRNRSLEARYKLAELRRDTLMLLGTVEWSQESITLADANLPPLQSIPTPPECRMVKESFTE